MLIVRRRSEYSGETAGGCFLAVPAMGINLVSYLSLVLYPCSLEINQGGDDEIGG